jgi:WD40 repeat protein
VSTEAAPQPPVIPDYELLRLIGRGAYGEVWLARGVTGIYRAVKLVWRDRFPEAGPYEREFHGLKEFAAISLSESRQLALLHVGRDPAAAYFYYVMELADDVTTGREIDPVNYTPYTLKEMRQRRGRLPAGECIALGADLARALSGLHARGLVHRDIKPSNVIIVGGAPKLADIGLVTEASAALTFVGTEGFVPPEGPGAPSADVFALGKLLYELLTGLDRHDYPRLPPELHTWFDRKEALELNEVLIRACEPHPDQRHVDAAALLDDLLLLQAGKSVRRLRKAERRLARALKIAAVLALIAGVAGLGAYVERQRANEEMAGRTKAEAERDALARQALYSAALTQAQRALEQDDYGRARKFLDEAIPRADEPDLREFEWHALRHEADGDPSVVVKASGAPGQRVVFSPDGRLLAARLTDQQSIIWDRSSLRELGRVSAMQSLAGFSTDGHWLLGADDKYALRRWSVVNGQPEPRETTERDWPLGRLEGDRWLTFVVATAQRPQQVRAWDFSTARELWRGALPHTSGSGTMETGDYFSSAVSDDGRACAIGLIHGRGSDARWRIMVLSLPDLAILWEQLFDHRPTALCFGRTSEELIYGWGDTGEAGLIDLRTNKVRWQTKLPMTQLRAVTHDRDRLLAVGGRSSLIALLDLDTGSLVATRRGQESDLVSLDFLPATHELLSTGNGGDVRLWSLQTDAPKNLLQGFWNPAGGGRMLCLSPDGDTFAATAGSGITRLVHTPTGASIADLPDTVGPVTFADASNLWLLTAEGSLALRSLAQPTANSRLVKLPLRAFIAAASPDSRWIGCLDREANLVLVDTRDATVFPVINTGHRYPWWLAVSADGTRMATGGVDALVRLWEIPSGRKLAEWKPGNDTVNAAFSPDGRRLVMTQATGTLEVRDLATDKTVVTIVTSSGLLQCAVFDPAAPRLFLGGRDGTMHVIDTARWQEVAQLKVAPGTLAGSLTRSAISADGETIAGYTESGAIRLWRKPDNP